MMRFDLRIAVVAAAIVVAGCGPSDKAEAPPGSDTAAQVAVEPDASPKNIGALSAEWQNAGDAILDDTRVRDVTFVLDGRGATVEVLVQAVDDQLQAQLINSEGQVVSETNVAAGQEGRLTGQATGGDRNMVRLIRRIPHSAPAFFSLRIRTIPESN